MRIIISGGPGSGCTSTANILGEKLEIPVFDSDSFLFKPTDPPYQTLYSSQMRRELLLAALSQSDDWIISGSIATWGVDLPIVHVGFFMDTPKVERLRRLKIREQERFGIRIAEGGDMHKENREFIEWASAYETGIGEGRNRSTDRDFLVQECDHFVEIGHTQSLEKTAMKLHDLLTDQTKV